MSASARRFFASRTGRGISVAIVDSGIHAGHPHVAGIAGGTALVAGSPADDLTDRIGHGTAVAAAVREKAPAVELYAVKIFDRRLETGIGTLVRAIDWAALRSVRLVNLSVGTVNPEHEGALEAAVKRAGAAGTIVVAAGPEDGVRWLPGSLPGVVAVGVDWDCPRDEYRSADGPARFRASGYPRPIPGRPPERNLHGASFAVANMTGFAARALEQRPEAGLDDLVAALRDGAGELELARRLQR